jgi:HK97 family phage portal protein
VGDHPAADLLAREFSGNTSAMTGRQTEVGHLLTWGNQYTQILRSRGGDLLELYPIGPDVVRPETNKQGDLQYKVYDREGGDLTTLRRDEVLHTPSFSFDAMVGLSTVKIAKTLIRQGIGQDRRAERFVARGLKSPGAIKMKKRFKDAAEAIQFRTRFRQIHQSGGDSDDEIMILEEEADWVDLGVSPDKAQALESRRFTRGEMAGLFHIPPHLIGDVDKATSWGTGIEELNIGFVTYCLLPILRALEQERNRKFFRAGVRADAGLFVEHVLAGLLRGDSKRQAETLSIYLNLGLLSVNEARRLIGFNPIVGGNIRYFPINMGRTDADTGEDIPPPTADTPTLPAAPDQPANDPPPAAALPPARHDTAAFTAFRKKLVQDVGRCLRKEAAEACKAAKKPGEFLSWMDDFYARLAEHVKDVYDTDLTAGYAERHVARSRADLLKASECKATELSDAVAKCVERWHTERIADLIGELTHAPV